MDARVRKLKILGVSDAEALVEAGIDSPRKIRAMSKTALKKLKIKDVDALKARFK